MRVDSTARLHPFRLQTALKAFLQRWWLDAVLVVALIAFAVWRFWCPPEVAVNKLQEAPKFTVGAWYLYKTGRYEWCINHQSYPAMGSVGYGLLLVPSFWLFGDFLGNAIYSQLALGVLTCLGVYAALRSCFGRWQGFVAGIVLASYPKFTEYCQMNDTSIAQAFLLTAGLLLFLKATADVRWSSLARWCLWGLCAGWAASVRLDSIATFGLLTLVLLWLVRSRLTDLVKRLGAAAAGAIGPLAYAGWYNQHYCGSWLRDPHCFWQSVPWDSGLPVFDIHMALGQAFTRENADSGNLLFYGREILGQLSGWEQLTEARKHLLIFPCLCLTGFMIVGIGYAWCQRRDSEGKLRFLMFTAVVTAATVLFYMFLPWHIVRLIVPLAPGMASFVGVGAVGLAQSLCRGIRAKILGALAALALAFAARQWISFAPKKIGDMLPVATILRCTAADIESNAVVISTAGPCLTDFFVIRGTQRKFVPPDHRAAWRVQPRPPKNRAIIPPLAKLDNSYPGDLENGAMDIFEFSALENPERIDQLLRQGIPVYFVDHTFGNQCDELPILFQYFEMQPVGEFEPTGILAGHSRPGPCLWRLRSRQIQEAIADLEQAVRINPDLAEAHYNLGVALMRQGKLREAVEDFDQALGLKPDFAEAHNNLGVALARLGRGQQAIKQFEQTLRIRPDYAEARNNLGASLGQAGRFQEAIEQFDLALRITPDDAETHCNLGVALERVGKLEDAIGHYEQALRIKPDYAEAQNRLARLRAVQRESATH